MILTLSTTYQPATDLGYLLHKNPARVHEMETGYGRAIGFFPVAREDLAKYALVLDIDPVALVRGTSRDHSGPMAQYVNDRPYVASSFLSVAIAKTLRNALQGASKERQDLAETAIPLIAEVEPLPVRGSDDMLRSLFEPLGYRIETETIPLDETLSYLGEAWMDSPYVRLRLGAHCRLRDLLAHLYVLIPVLDRKKHYFVDKQELEKLLAKGEGWLGDHPMRTFITARYLRNKRSWVREALERLDDDGAIGDALAESDETGPAVAARGGAAGGEDGDAAEGVAETSRDKEELALEQPLGLHAQRLEAVTQALLAAGVRRVVDLGCGSGKLIKRLMAEPQFLEILGVDVSIQSLEVAERRLKLDRQPERSPPRIRLLQGALTYRDKRIEGFDGAALVEVIEHLDAERLVAMERAVFGQARPGTLVVTTPNRDYNALFEGLEAGQFRHADHRFEWTREEFRSWAEGVADAYGYTVRFEGIGPVDETHGQPSQMAMFTSGRLAEVATTRAASDGSGAA